MSQADVDLVRSLVPDPSIDWAAAMRDDEIARGLKEASETAFTPDFVCGLIGVTETRQAGF